jgi:hypothetical protein
MMEQGNHESKDHDRLQDLHREFHFFALSKKFVIGTARESPAYTALIIGAALPGAARRAAR